MSFISSADNEFFKLPDIMESYAPLWVLPLFHYLTVYHFNQEIFGNFLLLFLPALL
jgi:hypothetical protein